MKILRQETMRQYLSFWKNYFNFQGKSTRKEYWIPALTNVVIELLIMAIGGTRVFRAIYLMETTGGYVSESDYSLIMGILVAVGLFSLVIIVPTWAIGARRFRDAGVNIRWFFIISFIPMIIFWAAGFIGAQGSLALLAFSVLMLICQLVIFLMPSQSMRRNIVVD